MWLPGGRESEDILVVMIEMKSVQTDRMIVAYSALARSASLRQQPRIR